MNSTLMAGAGLAFAALAAQAQPTGPFPLDDTGMQRCVNPDGSWRKDCTGTGQDGAYGRDATAPKAGDGHAGFAFRKLGVNGNALPNSATDWRCVADRVTGLVWEVKSERDGLGDADRVFTNWGDGRPGDASTLVAAANANHLCGGANWRLPTLFELQSLVDYGAAAGPSIDAAWFPNSREKWYWTADGYADDPNAAWGVFYSSTAGGDGAGHRGFKLAARLVHDTPSTSTGGGARYSFAGDEAIDHYTKLAWRRCAVGQTWTGSDCAGEPDPREWLGALAYANAEAERTGQAWRLPNAKELSTLADRTRKEPAIDPEVFPNVAKRQWYWSATPFAADATQAWTVDFTGGYTQTYPTQGYPLGLRLVRDAP